MHTDELSPRQHAAIVAGLRAIQWFNEHPIRRNPTPAERDGFLSIQTDDGVQEPLDSQEIEELIEEFQYV